MKEHLNKIRLCPEKPIEIPEENIFGHDILGFQDSVTRLSQVINNIETPFTVGIFGSWGSGKTSFMRLLQAYLAKENSAVTFWFNAWEYENETSLLLPLLSNMSKEFKEHKNAINSIKKCATTVTLLGTDILLKKFANTDLKEIEEKFKTYENEFEKLYDSWVSEIDSLKKGFKDLVLEIKKDKLAVIIFIDDLDRCAPENVIKLIENIKHFLSVDGCIFIIGVDKEILSKGIQVKYGSNLISGDEYLEKIISLSFQVPQQTNNHKDFIIENAKKLSKSKWEEISGEIEQFADILASLGIDNPRRLRLLILRYLFFLSLPEHTQYIREIVISLIVYREFFPDAYKQKEERNTVNYFPSLATDDLSYSEIKEKSGKGFADIVINKKYHKLRFYTDETIRLITCGLDKNVTNNPQILERIKIYKNNHTDYFNLVNFLFTLS